MDETRNSDSTQDGDWVLLDDLSEEFLARHRRGEQPDVEEYAKRYPQLAVEIRTTFPDMAILENVGSKGDGDAGSGRIAERDASGRLIGEFRILREIGRVLGACSGCGTVSNQRDYWEGVGSGSEYEGRWRTLTRLGDVWWIYGVVVSGCDFVRSSAGDDASHIRSSLEFFCRHDPSPFDDHSADRRSPWRVGG